MIYMNIICIHTYISQIFIHIFLYASGDIYKITFEYSFNYITLNLYQNNDEEAPLPIKIVFYDQLKN